MPISKDRVSYYYDAEVGSVYFGPNHPMKPHRLCMTHHLVLAYKLQEKMEVYRPRRAYPVEMATFHSEDYIDFLNRVTPDNQHEFLEQLTRFNLAEDCPIFDGLFDFCRIYTGGSIDGAVRLNHGLCDIAVNWSGGLHHAKRCEASGFCYINDLVLAILELLKYHARVLYIDIDIHHGDGVEEAFYTTDRCMTVSFHKYGDYFFPGTGALQDVGSGRGKYYSLNVPLKDGLDDASFQRLFKPIMTRVMEVYNPGAVVLQCGADSLSHDRLGCFNLSLDGHAECVRFMKKFKVPLMVTGGGGYTKSNVARCWAYETAVVTEQRLKDDIPLNDYYEYFADGNYKLKLQVMRGDVWGAVTQPHNLVDNANTKQYLNSVKAAAMEHLRAMEHAPGVCMHEVPPDHWLPDMNEEQDDDPDQRMTQRQRDKTIVSDSEYYDDVGERG